MVTEGNYPKQKGNNMAHELEIINGEAQMFSIGEVPWHRLGKVLPKGTELTPEEAIVAAGLDWEVETKDLFLADGTLAPSKATVRTDTNSILGVVGPQYTPLQNKEAFEFFRPFIESANATFETAGSLKGGKRIWALARINVGLDTVKGSDTIARYILLSNGHDGGTAVRAGFTNVRTVCQNTLSMAHESTGSKLIRIKHGSNVQENLKQVQEIMNVANREFETTLEQYKKLADTNINQADLEKYIKLVMVGEKKLKENPEAGKRILAKIIPLFEKGRGNDMEEIKGTYWAAYNSISEYLQYEKGQDEDNRLDSLWFGQSGNTLDKALSIAVKMAA